MKNASGKETSKTAISGQRTLSRIEADARNAVARDGLRAFYENLVRDSETPCSQCFDGNEEVCETCEWEDYESCGLWVLDGDYAVLEAEYENADPPKHPANPLRYSEALSEWIIPGTYMPYVSGTDFLFILDEYEMYAGFHYDYRIANSRSRVW